MKCSLEKHLKEEHQKEEAIKREAIFMNCPLFTDKQICLWCCLHIKDLAGPDRNHYREVNSHYYDLVTSLVPCEWDNMWEVCSKCSHR